MTRKIRYDDIEEGIIDDYALIDIRSNKESKEMTIPGSISIPIFTDTEREELNKMYEVTNPEEAKRFGVEIVSKKLPEIYDEVVKLSHQYKHLIFFCSAGGMRSTFVSSIFESLNINTMALEGGYKSYRDHVLENLPKLVENITFIGLHGNTRPVLARLQEKGMDTLSFGQGNSQENLEALIYDTLIHKQSNTVFLDGEEKTIGKAILPDYLRAAIEKGIHKEISSKLADNSDNIIKLIEECTNILR